MQLQNDGSDFDDWKMSKVKTVSEENWNKEIGIYFAYAGLKKEINPIIPYSRERAQFSK